MIISDQILLIQKANIASIYKETNSKMIAINSQIEKVFSALKKEVTKHKEEQESRLNIIEEQISYIQDSLQQLLHVKSVFAVGSFPGLDTAIQKLTADGSPGPADTQVAKGSDNVLLSHSELAAASSRQEDFHYISGMRVEVESDGLDSSL